MNFFFCESCGKRVTEKDLAAGTASDKKLRGVYCSACAAGVMTLEQIPLSRQEAEELLQSQAGPAGSGVGHPAPAIPPLPTRAGHPATHSNRSALTPHGAKPPRGTPAGETHSRESLTRLPVARRPGSSSKALLLAGSAATALLLLLILGALHAGPAQPAPGPAVASGAGRGPDPARPTDPPRDPGPIPLQVPGSLPALPPPPPESPTPGPATTASSTDAKASGPSPQGQTVQTRAQEAWAALRGELEAPLADHPEDWQARVKRCEEFLAQYAETAQASEARAALTRCRERLAALAPAARPREAGPEATPGPPSGSPRSPEPGGADPKASGARAAALEEEWVRFLDLCAGLQPLLQAKQPNEAKARLEQARPDFRLPESRRWLDQELQDQAAMKALREEALEVLRARKGARIELEVGRLKIRGKIAPSSAPGRLEVRDEGGAVLTVQAEDLSCEVLQGALPPAEEKDRGRGLRLRALLHLAAGRPGPARELMRQAGEAGLEEEARAGLERIERWEAGPKEFRARRLLTQTDRADRQGDWEEMGKCLARLDKEFQETQAVQERQADLDAWRLRRGTLGGSYQAGLAGSYYAYRNEVRQKAELLVRKTDSFPDVPRFNPPHPAVPPNWYWVEWEGFLKVDVAGAFSFSAQVDDFLRMTLDGRELKAWRIGDETPCPAQELKAGLHPIRIDYLEATEGAYCRLFWQRAGGGSPELIPASAFWHDPKGVPPPGLSLAEPLPPGTGRYLCELQPHSAEVGFGEGLPKAGRIWTPDSAILVNRNAAPHSLAAHAPSKLCYRLEGSHLMLQGHAALNDTVTGEAGPFVFEICGNGRSLWKSGPLRTGGQSEPFQVRIEEVTELLLLVHAPNGQGYGHSIWFEPRLLGVSNKAKAPAPPPSPLTEGLVAHWKLDETGGTTAADSSPKGTVGTLVNGPSWTAGRLGGALQFDGVDDYVDIGGEGLAGIENTFTIAAWVSPEGRLTLSAETRQGSAGTAGQRYAFFPFNAKHLGAEHAGAGIAVGTNGISVFEHADFYMPSLLVLQVSLSGWTHLALVYEDRKPKLYLNGLLARTGQTGSKPRVHPSRRLGGDRYGWYKGRLDDIRVYNRALTASEVAQLASGKP